MMRNIWRLGGVCALLIGSACPADGVPCVFEDRLTPVLTGTNPGGLALVGDHVYGVSDGNFTIWNFSDPDEPTVVGSVPVAVPFAERVHINGDTAYIGGGFYGLDIVDISNQQNPVLLGSFSQSLFNTDIAVGDRLMIVSRMYWLIYVDALDPTSLELIEFEETPGESVGYDIEGTLAYIVSQENDEMILRIVDASDVHSRQLLSRTVIRQTGEFSRLDVEVVGSRLYLLDENIGLDIFDVTDSMLPVHQSSVEIQGGTELLVDSDTVYIDADDRGVRVVDATDPSMPVLIGSFDTLHPVRGMVKAADRLMLSGGEGIEVWDIDAPTNPYAGQITTSLALDARIVGDTAVIADGIGGTRFIDISNAGSMGIVHHNPGNAYDIDAYDNLVAVARGHLGLNLWNLSTPDTVSILGQYQPTSSSIYDVQIDYPWAYITRGDYDRVEALDLTDPSKPVFINGLEFDDTPHSLIVIDGIGYLGVGTFGFASIGASEPTALAHLGTVELKDTPNDISVVGPFAYVAGRTAGLVIVDVSDPASMSIVAEFDVDGIATSIEVVGNALYLGIDEEGVFVFDISNPLSPILVGSYYGDEVRGMHISGDQLIVAGDPVQLIQLDAGCDVCPADLNNDGFLNFFDLSTFLQAFNAQEPDGDFTGDGSYNFFDISAYLQAFNAGCP